MMAGDPTNEDRAERMATRAARLSHHLTKSVDGRRSAMGNNDIYLDISADIEDYYAGGPAPIPAEVHEPRLEDREEFVEAVSQASGEDRRGVEDALAHLEKDAKKRRS